MDAKPLFVLIIFVMLIALFAGGALGSTDLTPNTPYVPGPSGTGGSGAAPNFMYQSGGGPCGGTYTVRQGDTLSQIARTCGVTLEILLAANPSIYNPNLIRPGQVLSIYYVAPTTQAIINTGGTQPTQAPPPAQVVQPTAAPAGETIPDTGILPGEKVTVSVLNFPPLTNVSVEMGVENGKLEKVKEPQTDTNGYLKVEVNIPPYAKPGETWIVVITSLADPNQVVRSPAFVIGP